MIIIGIVLYILLGIGTYKLFVRDTLDEVACCVVAGVLWPLAIAALAIAGGCYLAGDLKDELKLWRDMRRIKSKCRAQQLKAYHKILLAVKNSDDFEYRQSIRRIMQPFIKMYS